MYSESFMKYLINYQKEDCMVEENNDDTPKEIKFKPIKKRNPIKVNIDVKN